MRASLADAGEGVREGREAAVQLADRLDQPTILSLEAGRAGEVRRVGHGGVPDEQRRGQSHGHAADCRLDQAVGNLDDLRGL